MKALAFLQETSMILDEETDARLLRIIDWRLMPWMCLVYGMNYLDSMGYSPNAINGQDDEHANMCVIFRDYIIIC